MAIRNIYEAIGAEAYYKNHGSKYRNPHFATLNEVLPAMLDSMLVPALGASEGMAALEFSCLDFCCGSGEFTQILDIWCQKKGAKCTITGADPFTREAYSKATNRVARDWSFASVCDGVLDDEGATFDLVVISYAIHLLDPSRMYSFFNAMANHSKYMLIISPTKNKGLVSSAHGWEATGYETNRKVHLRLYRSLLY